MDATNFDDRKLTALAVRVGGHLLASRKSIVVAESCTGGWIGKVLTDVAGSSAWFAGGAIVYTNVLKERMLGVPGKALVDYGAVSEATVRAMAEGALSNLGGDIAIAVSGVAGPDGGTPEKPVGTVWIAWSISKVTTIAERNLFTGDRESVRRQSVAKALERVLSL